MYAVPSPSRSAPAPAPLYPPSRRLVGLPTPGQVSPGRLAPINPSVTRPLVPTSPSIGRGMGGAVRQGLDQGKAYSDAVSPSIGDTLAVPGSRVADWLNGRLDDYGFPDLPPRPEGMPKWWYPRGDLGPYNENQWCAVYFQSQDRRDGPLYFQGVKSARAIGGDPNAYSPWTYVVEYRSGTYVSGGYFQTGTPMPEVYAVPNPWTPEGEPLPMPQPQPQPQPVAPPGWEPTPYLPGDVPISPKPYEPFRRIPDLPDGEPVPVPSPAPAPAPGTEPGSVPRTAPSPAPGRQPGIRPAGVPGSVPRTAPAPAPAPADRPSPYSPSPTPAGTPYPIPQGVPGSLPLPVPQPEPIPRTKKRSEDDCCYFILGKLNEILDKLEDIEGAEIVDVSVPRFVRCGTSAPVIETITLPAFKGTEEQVINHFQSLADIESNQCVYKPANRNANELANGLSSPSQRVFYVPINDNVESVILVITGTLPSTLSLYSTSSAGEAQAKFGNIGLCVPAPGSAPAQIGEPGWIWTRRTYYQVPKCNLPGKSIRISLQPGLNWLLLDSGETV